MKGGLGKFYRNKREKEKKQREEEREAEENAAKERALNNYKTPNIYGISHKNILKLDNFTEENKKQIIDDVVNLINNNDRDSLKANIVDIMGSKNRGLNKVEGEKYNLYDIYQVIFSDGGDINEINSKVYKIFSKSDIENQDIIDALHPELKDDVAHRTKIGPTLGPNPPLLRQAPFGPKQGGKRRTKRRRQRRGNKKRTNKRKKTKTRMKKRKTHKRKTNKRRRKR
jgi:hypothetical protein